MIYYDISPTKTTVYRWFGEFNGGRSLLMYELKEGSSIIVALKENINAVREPIMKTRHVHFTRVRVYKIYA